MLPQRAWERRGRISADHAGQAFLYIWAQEVWVSLPRFPSKLGGTRQGEPRVSHVRKAPPLFKGSMKAGTRKGTAKGICLHACGTREEGCRCPAPDRLPVHLRVDLLT